MKIKYFVSAIIAALFLSSYINKDENLKPVEKAPNILRADGNKESLKLRSLFSSFLTEGLWIKG